MNEVERKERHRVAKAKYLAKPENREKSRAYSREYNRTRRTPEQKRASAFKHHHGVAREDADAMAAAQGNLCAICKQPPSGRGHNSRLHVDHDTKTGKLRGMLCHRCNLALGQLDDSIQRLKAAISYLSK